MTDAAESADAPDLLFNQSLEKGLAVLGAFNAQRRTMTIADVATAAGINKDRKSVV